MYTLYVLVRNLDSNGGELHFRNFRLREISQGNLGAVGEVRRLLRTEDVNYGDWLLVREYEDVPAAGGQDPARVGRIPLDAEETLLLLRLFKPMVDSVAISPDGKWLATAKAGGDGGAAIWDPATGRWRFNLEHEGPVNAVTFSPDSKWLAAGTGGLFVHPTVSDDPKQSVKAFSWGISTPTPEPVIKR